MESRYQNLLDELHTNKRELSNYRQKYLSLQSELIAAQQQSRNYKKTISSQKQTIQKLTQINKALHAEKESILSQYSTSVQSIKDQINKKQQEIYILKENTFSPLTNQKLFEKNLRSQIESEFQNQLETKNKRIAQLSEQLNKLNFDKTIDKEKYEIKLQSLQKELKEMQNAHFIELQNYANRTYQNSQSTKTSEEQTLIKRLRREIDELRIGLNLTQQQLQESINQKTKIQKQHSAFVNIHNKQVEKYAEQLRVLQSDNERYHSRVNKTKTQKEQSLIRQKQKQIKSVKEQLQEVNEKLNRLKSKYSQVEVELINKEMQIKRQREFSHKNENEKISQLKLQNQSFKRQVNEVKLVNQNLRKQNLQLINSISEINSKSVKHIQQQNTNNLPNKVVSAFSGQINQNRTNDQRVFIDDNQKIQTQMTGKKHQNNGKNFPSIIGQNQQNQEMQKCSNNLQRAKSSTNLSRQNLTKLQIYKKHYEQQCHKNKELSCKYVDLKKKYKNLQLKFTQANQKLMELIKDKIQLNSPTAASQKSFQFPNSPNPKQFLSPEPVSNHILRNSHQKIHSSKIQNHFTQSHFNPLRELHFSPQFTLPKPKIPQRSESLTKADQSFYQKSLKIKTSHKFREIRCLNHDDPQHDHANCSHSPHK